MGVRSLGYLRLESTDVPAWKAFGGDFLGMMPVEGADPDSLYFRIDHFPPRLVVEPGAENRMTAMGFEVLNKRELAQLVAPLGEPLGAEAFCATSRRVADRELPNCGHDPA